MRRGKDFHLADKHTDNMSLWTWRENPRMRHECLHKPPIPAFSRLPSSQRCLQNSREDHHAGWLAGGAGEPGSMTGTLYTTFFEMTGLRFFCVFFLLSLLGGCDVLFRYVHVLHIFHTMIHIKTFFNPYSAFLFFFPLHYQTRCDFTALFLQFNSSKISISPPVLSLCPFPPLVVLISRQAVSNRSLFIKTQASVLGLRGVLQL